MCTCDWRETSVRTEQSVFPIRMVDVLWEMIARQLWSKKFSYINYVLTNYYSRTRWYDYCPRESIAIIISIKLNRLGTWYYSRRKSKKNRWGRNQFSAEITMLFIKLLRAVFLVLCLTYNIADNRWISNNRKSLGVVSTLLRDNSRIHLYRQTYITQWLYIANDDD